MSTLWCPRVGYLFCTQSSYASLPVKIDDDGNEFDAVPVGGSEDTQYTTGDGAGTSNGLGLKAVISLSVWWLGEGNTA